MFVAPILLVLLESVKWQKPKNILRLDNLEFYVVNQYLNGAFHFVNF